MNRILPYPFLAASLLIMWLLLNGFTPGRLLLGAAVSVIATHAMTSLQPSKPRVRRWALLPRLAGIVFVDILRSNVAVASIVLRGRRRERVSGFVPIPLDLRDRTGLALLACIVTSTPGTAWVEYDTDAGVLLLHVLDLVEQDEWIAIIKDRYEAMLLEIFE